MGETDSKQQQRTLHGGTYYGESKARKGQGELWAGQAVFILEWWLGSQGPKKVREETMFLSE